MSPLQPHRNPTHCCVLPDGQENGLRKGKPAGSRGSPSPSLAASACTQWEGQRAAARIRVQVGCFVTGPAALLCENQGTVWAEAPCHTGIGTLPGGRVIWAAALSPPAPAPKGCPCLGLGHSFQSSFSPVPAYTVFISSFTLCSGSPSPLRSTLSSHRGVCSLHPGPSTKVGHTGSRWTRRFPGRMGPGLWTGAYLL